MPLQLKAKLERTLPLVRTDEAYGGSETTVTIRQASQYQHEKRQEIFSNMRSKYSNDGDGLMEIIQRFNALELHRLDVQLTLVDCNIIGEDEKPLFKFRKDSKGRSYLDMSDAEFEEAWGSLPVDIADEIYEKVLEVNPSWSPSGE
jgi:hypothetical protein